MPLRFSCQSVRSAGRTAFLISAGTLRIVSRDIYVKNEMDPTAEKVIFQDRCRDDATTVCQIQRLYEEQTHRWDRELHTSPASEAPETDK